MNTLKEAILRKYGTITNAAEFLGIDESTLHRNIRRATPKFLYRLKEVGIVVDNIPLSTKKKVEIVDLSQELIQSLREQIQLLKDKVKKLEDEKTAK